MSLGCGECRMGIDGNFYVVYCLENEGGLRFSKIEKIEARLYRKCSSLRRGYGKDPKKAFSYKA